MESDSEKVKTEEDVQRHLRLVAAENTTLATASLILGVISLLGSGFLAGIPAVVVGHIALWKIKRGTAGGRKKALWGLVTGYVGTFLVTSAIAFSAWLTHLSAQESVRKISCGHGNLKQIGLSLYMYSNVYDGKFPPYNGAKGLDVLVQDDFLSNARTYRCPSVKHNGPYTRTVTKLTEANCDYRYFGGHNENDPPNTIIACDKPNNHDKYGNVLFLDGHVKGYDGADWLDKAKKSEAY